MQILGRDVLDSVVADAPRVREWLRAVRDATAPHFTDAETVLRAIIARRNKGKGEAPALRPGAASQPGGGGAPGDSFPEGAEMNKLYSPSAAPGARSRAMARM